MAGDSEQAIGGNASAGAAAGSLGRVLGDILLGVLFFAVVLPAGLAMRAIGRDPLRLRRDPKASSYWVPRDMPGPTAGTMKSQF
jgi:hypothetical protein